MTQPSSSKIIKLIKDTLSPSQDVAEPVLRREGSEVRLLYIKSLCDENKIVKEVIHPYYDAEDGSQFLDFIASMPGSITAEDDMDIIAKLLRGHVLICGSDFMQLWDAKQTLNNQVSEATVEISYQGPLNAFSEHLSTNINLIRSRFPSPNLAIEQSNIGTLSQTPLAMIYNKETVDPDLLSRVKKQISSVNQDIVQDVGQLQNLVSRPKRSLFPTVVITERPDRTVLNLAQGKVVVMLEGSSFAMVAPAAFFDFFSAMTDLYQSYWISRALIYLRYIGLFVSLLLPAFYIIATSYNPEIFKAQLAFSIAGSRAAVPYPSFVEVLFMLTMMEMLTEASIRLPKAVSSTATTVGGLILGQAATQAGLVSNIMIIIIASVAISNFVIPLTQMSFAMRVVRYPLLFFATVAGLAGMVVGAIALLIYLADLRSYGQPYLKLFMGTSAKVSDIQNQVKQGKTSE